MKVKPENVKIEASWKQVLHKEFEKPYFSKLKAQLIADIKAGKTIYPPNDLIFKAFELSPFEQTKVVILGQDPYHNPGEAMGLCFSVPHGVNVPPSLKRIYKEVGKDIGCPAPVHGDLTKWGTQGVLLLNAILTVEKNSAGAHRRYGWQQFTDAVIEHINGALDHVVFMLWGNFAKSKALLIDEQRHLILKSVHPSPLAGNAFFDNNHFSKANEYLRKHNKTPIDWCIK